MTSDIQICGGVSKVDSSDFAYISRHSWYMCADGYAKTNLRLADGKRKVVGMHRLVMGLRHDERIFVDHINGDKLDNRKANLRVCTFSQNMMNRGAQSNNTSGFKGVSFHKGQWRATIAFQKKTKHLGYYPTPREAHEAYCLCADMLHGEFANYGKVSA